jgi:hypothetical protein
MTEKALRGQPKNDESPPDSTKRKRMKNMNEDTGVIHKVYEEIANFQKTMEELYLLKKVAADLKSFRKMLKLKRYD